jgi:ABC-type transporter Mla MlaB component
MITRKDENTLMIDMPAYLTMDDLGKVMTRVMRQMVLPNAICIINMANVHNVYNATIQFLLRINDRAKRLENEVYIINASTQVCNALNNAGISERIFICENYLAEAFA